LESGSTKASRFIASGVMPEMIKRFNEAAKNAEDVVAKVTEIFRNTSHPPPSDVAIGLSLFCAAAFRMCGMDETESMANFAIACSKVFAPETDGIVEAYRRPAPPARYKN